MLNDLIRIVEAPKLVKEVRRLIEDHNECKVDCGLWSELNQALIDYDMAVGSVGA